MTRKGWLLGVVIPLVCSGCAGSSSDSGKADAVHDHDGRYYTEAEVDAALAATEAEAAAALAAKADAVHTHDDRYYTRAEVDAAVAAAAPRAYVATMGAASIGPNTEANAVQYLVKGTPQRGQYIARVDAELNTFGALYFNYSCKLQYLTYPALVGQPFSDLAGTRRTVSWRLGRELSGSGAPVSISMQAPVTAGTFGLDVRMVCWGEWDGASPPIVDYGNGINSAILTLTGFASVN